MNRASSAPMTATAALTQNAVTYADSAGTWVRPIVSAVTIAAPTWPPITEPIVRITVFMLCSTLAAAGGIMAASRLYAVNQSSGGSDVLLNAIAAAVIGGTSLFGGRGSAYSALLGILVIQSITNGMLLLNLGTDVRFIITGAVLLAAVTVDAVARRGREASGRA